MDDQDGSGERKGQRWTPEEDAMLKAYLEEFGNQRRKWTLISEKIPGRSETGCRVRWAQLCGKRNQPSKKVRPIETGVTLAITTDINVSTITGNSIAGKRTPGPIRKRKRDGTDNAHEDDDPNLEFSEEHESKAGKKVPRRASAPPPSRRRGPGAGQAKRQKLEELATIASATFTGEDDDLGGHPSPAALSKGRKSRQSQPQYGGSAAQLGSGSRGSQFPYPQTITPSYPVTVMASLDDRKQMIPGSWISPDQIRDALMTSFDLRGAPATGTGSVIIEYESKVSGYPGEWVPLTSQTLLASLGNSVKMRIRFEQPPTPIVNQPDTNTHSHMPPLNQSGGISPAALHAAAAVSYPSAPSTGINMAAVHAPYGL